MGFCSSFIGLCVSIWWTLFVCRITIASWSHRARCAGNQVRKRIGSSFIASHLIQLILYTIFFTHFRIVLFHFLKNDDIDDVDDDNDDKINIFQNPFSNLFSFLSIQSFVCVTCSNHSASNHWCVCVCFLQNEIA